MSTHGVYQSASNTEKVYSPGCFFSFLKELLIGNGYQGIPGNVKMEGGTFKGLSYEQK
jgi:hypothetical protein